MPVRFPRRVLTVVTALSLAAAAGTAVAQTPVCGPITTNTTWDITGSPYRLTCDVAILNSAVLTIDPGVTVLSDFGTAIVVQTGQVVAHGLPGQEIVFLPSDASTPGNGFRIMPGSGGSISVKHAVFRRLQTAVQTLCCGGSVPPAIIEDSEFSSNVSGVSGYAGGPSSAYQQVTRCTFSGNQNAVDTADKIILDCIFTGNVDAVNNVERTTVQGCNFSGNVTALSTPGNNYVVDVSLCTFTGNTTAILRAPNVRRCTVTGNGVGIDVTNPSAIIECNDIWGNTTHNLKNFSGTSLNLPNNWWGTTSTAAIDAGIVDGSDQIGLGFVLYTPYLPGDWSETSTCACTVPTVTSQPASQTAYANSSVSFTVAAAATGAPSYAWRFNGVPIPNFAPRFSGQNTPTLTLNPVGQPGNIAGWTDAGNYDCVITNVCGTVISNPATLSVQVCGADFNQSGTITVQDIFDFLAVYFSGCP